MPLPWILIPIALVLLGGAAAVTLWPRAKGKRILILGAEGVGKTTLTEFLVKGELPADYVRTMNTKTHKLKKDIKLRDLKLNVEEIWDVAGERDAWEAWLDKAKEADLILYLINHEKRKSRSYASIVRRDTGQIMIWRRSGDLRQDALVMIVVTHCDKAPQFFGLSPRAEGGTAATWAKDTQPVKEALVQLGRATPLVAGSMKSPEYAGRLVYRVLEATPWSEDG